MQLNTTTASHKAGTESRELQITVQCPQMWFLQQLSISVQAETTASIVFVIISAQRLSASYLEALHMLLSQIWLFTVPQFHTVCRAMAFQHSSPGLSLPADSRLSCLQSNTQACTRTLSRRKTEPRMHINYCWHKAQARLLLHSQAINLSK